MQRPHPSVTRELETLRRELQKRDQELEAMTTAKRELAARTRELADERGRNHLLQAEVRELKSLTMNQSHKLAHERARAEGGGPRRTPRSLSTLRSLAPPRAPVLTTGWGARGERERALVFPRPRRVADRAPAYAVGPPDQAGCGPAPGARGRQESTPGRAGIGKRRRASHAAQGQGRRDRTVEGGRDSVRRCRCGRSCRCCHDDEEGERDAGPADGGALTRPPPFPCSRTGLLSGKTTPCRGGRVPRRF